MGERSQALFFLFVLSYSNISPYYIIIYFNYTLETFYFYNEIEKVQKGWMHMGGAWGGTGRSKGKGNTNSTYYKKIQFQQKENSSKLTVRPKILYQNLLL